MLRFDHSGVMSVEFLDVREYIVTRAGRICNHPPKSLEVDNLICASNCVVGCLGCWVGRFSFWAQAIEGQIQSKVMPRSCLPSALAGVVLFPP